MPACRSRFVFGLLVLLGGALFGCKTRVTEVSDTLDGTCVNCHRGLSAVHPNGANISCVNCHGGDATQVPFLRAGEEVAALLTAADPIANDPNGGRFIPVNPTDLADGRFDDATLAAAGITNPFVPEREGQIGRETRAFQVLLASAHNLPKGCAGPREIEPRPLGANDPDGLADLDNDGDPRDRVHFLDLTPGQQENLRNANDGQFNDQANDDCHAVFFWPNGVDDDGDGFVDELGEFSMFNPTDPTGLQFEFSKVLAKLDDPANGGNGNGQIDPDEGDTPIGLAEAKTIKVPLDLNGDGTPDQDVDVPVKLGQVLDSEFNMDLNYVRWLNPGDLRVAQVTCGRASRANSFLGNCHGLEVDTTRRSIMSTMAGVLAGATYANGASPNHGAPGLAIGTNRDVQDLRDGRIAYLQNYDALDKTFDPKTNRFVFDNGNDPEVELDLQDIFLLSSQNQIDWDEIFGVEPVAGLEFLQENGLNQDDCIDGNVAEANFTGNLCLESYPEALFRLDDVQLEAAAREGVDAATAARVTTLSGTATVEHGGDVFLQNRPSRHRLIWEQKPLQDPLRSLFVLAPIPRRSLTGPNAELLTNADAIADAILGVNVNVAAGDGITLPAAPQNEIVAAGDENILDDRQFSNTLGINPVDTALHTFRPFHSLSFPNITGDFFFFDEFQLLDDAPVQQNVFILRNNPFGRGRGTGCTSCHMLYNMNGVNEEPDPTVRLNGKQPGDVALGRSPLVKGKHGLRTSSLFNAAQQVGDVDENGAGQATFLIEADEEARWREVRELIAGALSQNGETIQESNLGRLQYPTGMDDFGRERFYPAQHKITTEIPSQQCEFCHAFVTRVGFAAFGRHENEGGMEFINWYTWTPKDLGGQQADGKITHAATDANANGFADGDGEIELGIFVTNRAAAPEQDFLEFRNAKDPTQKVRIFNNLPAFVKEGGSARMVNTGLRGTEDVNNDGLLNPNENVSDIGDGPALDLPDRPGRDRIFDGRQQRAVYGGASGAVLLQDIHLERGMHCIDCHFFQDNHGDGNLYARNWDAVEIECVDCHGTATRRATLVTSGPNGGHDLTLSKGQDNRAFFEIGAQGQRIQRSRVIPGLEFVIPQVADSIDPKNPRFNPEAAEAMGVLELNPRNPADNNAHIAENIVDAHGVERPGFGKLECSSCHSSWTPNCMTCHMDFDYSQTVGEIWATQERNPISFFQLFTIVRSPFVLAPAGSNEGNKIMTQRSLMELHPNITISTGDALAENLTFSTPRGVSGVAMNQYMAHTVRREETKDCESCHTLTPNDLARLQQQAADPDASPFDDILNNNILAQTLGLGSGRLGEPGDFMFAASSAGLEGIDIKAESRRALDDDGDGIFQFSAQPNHNTFQGFRGQGFGSGFLVASIDDTAITNTGLNIDRSFAAATVAGGGADVVLVRNFIDPTELDPNTNMFIGNVRALDLAVVASATQLQVGMVTDRTGTLFNNVARLPSGTNTVDLGATIRAIDHIAPDMSDPFVFAVTDRGNNTGDILVIDLRVLALGREGANGQIIASQRTLTGTPTDIEIDGNFAFVLVSQGNNPASLQILDARALKYFDREVDNLGSQMAVDFLLVEPGTLGTVGEAPLTVGGQTCTDPRKVAVFGIMAYIACGEDGLFVVNIEDPLNPRAIGSSRDAADFNPQNPGTPILVAGGLDDAQGLYASDNRLFVANGNAQNANNAAVVVFDVTVPKEPRPVRRIKKAGALGIVDPVDIIGFVEPGQLWLLVSDSAGRAHAINVTEAYNIRVRLGEHAAAARGLLGNQTAEANGSVPGFRPEEEIAIFASQALLSNSPRLAEPRPFFEDTNVRFTLDLRDWLTPNDPAQIDEILAGTPQVITFLLEGTGDIRLAQTSDLDRMADFSGFATRDTWASAAEIVSGCATLANGRFSSTDCTLDEEANLGRLGARSLSGPHLEGGVITRIIRGQMDVMRSVFVREVDGFDRDGNGMGNLVCVGVAERNANGSVDRVADCKALYPADLAEILFAAP